MNWSPRVLEKRRLNVLLVDHHTNLHAPILQHYFLQVTSVKYASTGLSILQSGSPKIDVVMENIKSPDMCGFRLLHAAVEKDLHVILLLEEDDYALTKMAVEAGALICITKPLTMGMAECLWQIVVGENLRRIRIRNNNININFIQQQEQEVTSYDMSNNIASSERDIINSANNIKVWTEWTPGLHNLFIDAVRTLGEGRCYPKDILELMNVPGLTRMQVASHLQKCRSGTWLPPRKRKARVAGANRDTRGANISRRFGFMPPRLGPNKADHRVNVGAQTTNIGSPDWGPLPPNDEQLVVDAYTSPPLIQNGDGDGDGDECFDEFPSIDSMMGGFCVAVDDIHMVYSNLQVPVMNNADVDKWEEADNDANTQVVIKEEK